MNRALPFLLPAAALAAASFLSIAAGCGGGGAGGASTASHGSTGAGATGTGAHTVSSTTGAGGGAATTAQSASSASSASSSGPPPPPLDCTSYCSEVMTNCTAQFAQLPDMATCMSVCAEYPLGTSQDKSGDTLGCRIYHAGTPAMLDPATHCPHAGPTGGDKDPSGTSGTCGEPCEAFCEIALVVCANQPNVWTSASACLAECMTFAPDGQSYSTADQNTNDMGCRFTHLSLAAESAAAAVTHCAFIHATSAECTM